MNSHSLQKLILIMYFMLPEYRFTEEEAAEFKNRGKRCAEKRGPDFRSMRICGYEVSLPPFPFVDKPRIEYLPGTVAVFQVYTRNGRCVGASRSLGEAQQLMSKRGRNAGHKLHVCVDYSPRGTYAITARVCIARIGRELAQTLYVQNDNAIDPAEAAHQQEASQ